MAPKHTGCPGTGPAARAAALVALLALWLPAAANWHGADAAMMGTRINVTLWHEDADAGQRAIDAVFAEVDRIERLMSTYREDSAISAVNRDAATRPIEAGEELARLVARSLELSRLTGGAFDITYDSVGQHYDFRERRRPDAGTLAVELERIDYRLVAVDASAWTIRFARPGVRINLGGIAKGYAVERGVELLRALGVESAIVTAGGDTRLLGDRRGEPWVVGIQNPRSDDGVAVRLPLVDEAISTSGDYERYFEEDGERYHHILSPGTGNPVKGVHSATVIGPDGVMTDALSTAVFVLGPAAGLALIESLADYEAVVVDDAQRLSFSSGLAPPGQ